MVDQNKEYIEYRMQFEGLMSL